MSDYHDPFPSLYPKALMDASKFITPAKPGKGKKWITLEIDQNSDYVPPYEAKPIKTQMGPPAETPREKSLRLLDEAAKALDDASTIRYTEPPTRTAERLFLATKQLSQAVYSLRDVVPK